MAIKAKISDSTSGPAQVSVTVPAQVQVDINNTDDLSEGSTNLYYTETRGTATVVNQLQYITSTGLATINNGDINIHNDGRIGIIIHNNNDALLLHKHRNIFKLKNYKSFLVVIKKKYRNQQELLLYLY